MNTINDTGSTINIKDLLNAYLSKVETIENRLQGIETRLENSVTTLNADILQDAMIDNNNFVEVRRDINNIKQDIITFHRDLSNLTKTISDSLHSIEINGKDCDSAQNIQIKDLELRMLGIGAGSGTLTTFILQVIMEYLKIK